MKRNELIPFLVAGLMALLGGGLFTASRRSGHPHSSRVNTDAPWLMLLLLLLAGISLVVFLTYAFAFAYSASNAVI